MFGDSFISENKTIIASHMKKEYGLDTSNLVTFDDFTDVCFRSITSIKIWDAQLKASGKVAVGPASYLSEISSNLNQVVIMGILGLGVPSYTMLRRSLENILTFLYYKDHPIEFFLKDNNDKEKKLQMETLKQYIKEYPFEIQLNQYNVVKIKDLVNKLISLYNTDYVQLSNYVHGKNLRYLEFYNYLDDLKPNDALLTSLVHLLNNLSAIINVLNIVFFFDIYKQFEESKKEIIRLSISNKGHYKQSLLAIFGEF